MEKTKKILMSITLFFAAHALAENIPNSNAVATTPMMLASNSNSSLPNVNPNSALFPVSAPKPNLTATPPNIRARAYILIDANSGKVLVSQNSEQRLPPASLTKMMTSYIVSEALYAGRVHMNDLVRISEKAWHTGGSKMFVKVGDFVPVSDLLQGIIVHSGNDASVAMAEHIAGSEESFANLMNQEAAALGMTETHFIDANGLPDPQHYTTARDMAILARAVIFNFPEDYKIYSQKTFTYNHITQPNRNRLLWRDASVDGLKTGHTDEAGYCLVASAQRNGMRLISVVMGTPSDSIRADDSQKLLNYGFRFFETKKLFSANTALEKARVWLGNNKFVPVGIQHDLYITTQAGQANNLKTNLVLNRPIKAPVNKGEILGTLQILSNNNIISTQPVYALETDARANFIYRITDYIRLGLYKVLGSGEST